MARAAKTVSGSWLQCHSRGLRSRSQTIGRCCQNNGGGLLSRSDHKLSEITIQGVVQTWFSLSAHREADNGTLNRGLIGRDRVDGALARMNG